MKIANVGYNSPYKRPINFKAADVNILAQADQHGNIMTLPAVEQTIKYRSNKMFKNPQAKSTLNVLAFPGDFIINPSKKGYITHPEKTNGDFQVKYLNEIIGIARNAVNGNNFEALYTPGNHDYDGGDVWLMDQLSKLPMTTVMTNINLEKSPLVSKYFNENKNIVPSKVLTVQDDKNPDLEHKVLFVGATIPTFDFYAPELMEGTEYYGNGNKKDIKINEEDMETTIQSISSVVNDFKTENPRGAVVLMSHTGNRISNMIRERVPQIDIILNGHDHEDTTIMSVAQTQDGRDTLQVTSSLGMDNKILKSFNLHFDDDGKLQRQVSTQTYSIYSVNMDDLSKNRIHNLIQEDFAQDIVPLVEKLDPKGKLTEFKYGKFIRWQNSHLLNYLSSALHGVVKNEFNGKYKDITAVAVQTSGVRGGIKEGSTNLDLMKVFDGVSENISGLYIGEVEGEDLIGMIVENVRDNLGKDKRERSTLLYWSNIQINRELICDILEGRSDLPYTEAIILRGEDKKFSEKIDLDKKYKILLPKKYLIKTDIEYPNKIRDNFEPFGKTSDELLRMALKHDEYKKMASEKVKEMRILDSRDDR